MSTGFIFSSIIEVLMAAAVIFAVVKNDKLVEFEERIAARLFPRREGRHAIIVKADDNRSHCA